MNNSDWGYNLHTIDFSDMRVEFDGDIGCILLGGEPYLTICGNKNVIDFKNNAVKWFANRIDECLAKSLNMTFPYVVGDITFCSLSEVEKYILGTINRKSMSSGD